MRFTHRRAHAAGAFVAAFFLCSTAMSQDFGIRHEVESNLPADSSFADQHNDGRTIVASTTQEGCTVSWYTPDGLSEISSVTFTAGDQMAPLTTVCSGARAVTDDAVAILTWVDASSYTLVALRSDGSAIPIVAPTYNAKRSSAGRSK